MSMKRRFGWRRTIPVLALWAARQTIQYRKARVYHLDLRSIPEVPHCSQFEWDFRERDAVEPSLIPDSSTAHGRLPGAQRWFVGSCEGVGCYASAVSSNGFSVPDRITVTFTAAGAAYVGDCFTLEKYRGRGLYPCGLVELGRRLRSEGKTDLYLFVELDNLASIGSVEKAGFHAIAESSVWKVRQVSKRRWRFLPPAPSGPRSQWKVELAKEGQNQ
jgi:hypothetical protein